MLAGPGRWPWKPLGEWRRKETPHLSQRRPVDTNRQMDRQRLENPLSDPTTARSDMFLKIKLSLPLSVRLSIFPSTSSASGSAQVVTHCLVSVAVPLGGRGSTATKAVRLAPTATAAGQPVTAPLGLSATVSPAPAYAPLVWWWVTGCGLHQRYDDGFFKFIELIFTTLCYCLHD